MGGITEEMKFGFGKALELMKEGRRMRRAYWQNANAVFLVQGSKFTVNRAPLNQFFAEGTEVEYRPHLDLIASDGTVGVWSVSNADILAEDWYVVE